MSTLVSAVEYLLNTVVRGTKCNLFPGVYVTDKYENDLSHDLSWKGTNQKPYSVIRKKKTNESARDVFN